MNKLPHVIWDMGGILYRYFTELLLDVGADRGWPLDRLPLGPTGLIPDENYQRMLVGEFDEPQYLQRVVSELAAAGIDFDPPRDLRSQFTVRPETWAAIQAIHDAGHRQAILTNDASKWLGDGWWTTWGPARWFDAMIDVKTIGVRKPAPEPYLEAARALGALPEACLFVDDMPVNCRGAEAVGMASYLFDIVDPQGSIDGLLEILQVET